MCNWGRSFFLHMEVEVNLNIIEIANKIKECGGKLYLVGGAVRDELLRKEAQDKDYCVVGLNSEQFKQLFPQANIRGKAFEVFDLEGSEFAMARTETKIGKGHTEFKIETNPQITIELPTYIENVEGCKNPIEGNGDIDIEDIKTMFELIMDDSYVLTYRDEAYSPYNRPQVIEL